MLLAGSDVESEFPGLDFELTLIFADGNGDRNGGGDLQSLFELNCI